MFHGKLLLSIYLYNLVLIISFRFTLQLRMNYSQETQLFNTHPQKELCIKITT